MEPQWPLKEYLTTMHVSFEKRETPMCTVYFCKLMDMYFNIYENKNDDGLSISRFVPFDHGVTRHAWNDLLVLMEKMNAVSPQAAPIVEVEDDSMMFSMATREKEEWLYCIEMFLKYIAYFHQEIEMLNKEVKRS